MCGHQEIDPSLSFAMVDRVFGGVGKTLPEYRDLTELERSVLTCLATRLLGCLREAWQPVVSLRSALGVRWVKGGSQWRSSSRDASTRRLQGWRGR